MVAELLKPLPDIPLVIGDALQNLRNSLDNLAFALALAHTPNMTSQQEKDESFPISDRAIVSTDRRIKMMSPNAKSDICSLAPDPGRQPLDQDPLWLLNKTNNRDKHRGVSVFAVAAGIQEVAIHSGSIDHLRLIGPQQLELGVISEALMEWAPKAHMNAKLSHSLKVTFDKGVEVENWEVIPTLRWIHKHIRDTVFQRLEQYLWFAHVSTPLSGTSGKSGKSGKSVP